MPIWVKLPGLDFKYWSARLLSNIGSLVGKALMVDKHTKKKIGLNFATLLVEVEAGVTLPNEIAFRNDKGIVITTYDWKPSICEHCHKYGHEKYNCRKLKFNQKGDIQGGGDREGNTSIKGVSQDKPHRPEG